VLTTGNKLPPQIWDATTGALLASLETPAFWLDLDATFSHVGARVTFEVMLASFSLEQPALKRVGAIVHYLDAGGVQPPEASGVESVLAGLRDAIDDDDQLVKAANAVFDALLTSFESQADAP
jgi:hypothetical protein